MSANFDRNRAGERRFFDRFGPGLLRVAHRGDRACFPENTSCAFAACVGRSPMIELDVQCSADGAVMVFHDTDLARTSDAAVRAAALGQNTLILADWPLAALQQLDCGSWFLAEDPFGTLADGRANRTQLARLMPQRMPLLVDVLGWARQQRMAVNVEIKPVQPSQAAAVVSAVVGLIRGAGMADEVVISSFDFEVLRHCRDLAPEIAGAALVDAIPVDLLATLERLGVCACHPADAVTNEDLIQTLRATGFHVNVYTVNDPARQQQLFDWGATSVFTDFP